MKWYLLNIVAWVADAIRRKAEINKEDSVEARLERIEEKLTKIEKSNIPVALFASGIPVYFIGFAGSLDAVINAKGIEGDNITYLVIGILLVTYAMRKHTGSNRNGYVITAVTFGILIVASLIVLLLSS